ncbi:MAG: FAD-dependent oxidoreductase [Bacteroidota bacterium]
MTRKEFIKLCGLLGLGVPFQATSSSLYKPKNPAFSGSVLVIGAGAAGLSAGHLLNQKGISYKILEATSGYGGRMKKTDHFADFPIPLGAEWLTVSTSIFDKTVNNNSVSVDINTVGYNQNDTYGLWQNNKLLLSDLGDFNYRKFVNSTWFDFFDKYIFPTVSQNIIYDSVVNAIDYSKNKVIVKTQNETYTADKIIVTIPLKILQNGRINFTPLLPKDKLKVINDAVVWDGIKVFLEFSKNFYPAYIDFKITPATDGQVSYFDAAFGQHTNKNILGLFAVGAPAKNYTTLYGENLKNYILNELDEIFSNQASPNYIKHIVQDWSKEPHIEGAYLNDYADWKTPATMFKPVDNKVYFAGDAYTSGNDWGSVHTAAQAAMETVAKIAN